MHISFVSFLLSFNKMKPKTLPNSQLTLTQANKQTTSLPTQLPKYLPTEVTNQGD
jgi:hypothetical protein